MLTRTLTLIVALCSFSPVATSSPSTIHETVMLDVGLDEPADVLPSDFGPSFPTLIVRAAHREHAALAPDLHSVDDPELVLIAQLDEDAGAATPTPNSPTVDPEPAEPPNADPDEDPAEMAKEAWGHFSTGEWLAGIAVMLGLLAFGIRWWLRQ